MNTQSVPRPFTRLILAVLVFSLLLGLFGVGIHQVTQKNKLGIDFYIYWLAGQAAFIDQTNPYSDLVAQQAQMGTLKRLARPDEDQIGFAYPLYGLFAILPVNWLSFEWAQSFWMAFNILAMLLALLAIFGSTSRWKPFLFLLPYPIFFGLLLGNFVVPISIIVLLFFGLLVQQRQRSQSLQIFLGLLLAWATAKPQFMWLFLAFLLLYALKERLWPLLISFTAGVLLLLAASFWLRPEWVGEWMERALKYTQYMQAWPTLLFFVRTLVPHSLAVQICAVVAALAAPLTVVLFHRWWQGQLDALLLLAWAGWIIFLLHPRDVSYEQLSFLMPL